MSSRSLTRLLVAAVAAGAAAVATSRAVARRRELRGKVAVVCGGSRGLGRALARELVQRGARVAICGRSAESLEQTRIWLQAFGPPVMAEVCDLRDSQQTASFLARVGQELGPIDVLVANAATIDVAPLESLGVEDFDAALREILSSAMHSALAVLPAMRARRRGNLTFIASIGGKLAVPHLAPYSTAKFAVVGFAEALAAETAKDGVRVLTVTPGLMRTGSHLHATFRGDPARELSWFGAAATTPLLSIDADRAARRIAGAIACGDRYLTFTPAAHLGAWLHDTAPHLWASIAATTARLLPRAREGEAGHEKREGAALLDGSSWLLRYLAKVSEPLAVEHGQ